MDRDIDCDHSRRRRPPAVQLTSSNVQSAVGIHSPTREADWKQPASFFCVSANFSVMRKTLQQFDFADDGGRSGEFHVVIGHVDAQGAATHGDHPMVDAGFGTQRDGGGAQESGHAQGRTTGFRRSRVR